MLAGHCRQWSSLDAVEEAESPSTVTYRRLAHGPVYDWLVAAGSLGVATRAPVLAVARLELREGDRVVDVACGSGPVLHSLSAQVGSRGRVVGIDASGPMLARARRRAERLPNVDLLAGEWPRVEIASPVDGTLCCLGLSVVADWREAVDHMLRVTRPGRRVVVMDLLMDGGARRGRLTRAYVGAASAIGAADPGRPVVDELTDALDGVRLTELPLGFVVLDGAVPAHPDGGR